MKYRIIPFAFGALALACMVIAKDNPGTISVAQQKALLALTSIGFQGKDDRLPIKRRDIVRAIRHYNAGDLSKSLAALKNADAIMPVEVVDFSSWPLQDILVCKQSASRAISQSKTYCANAFETGSATCSNVQGLEAGCVQNYCEYELYRPAYEKTHASYLSQIQEKSLQSALRIVQAHCGK
jgi:hypothetical protein